MSACPAGRSWQTPALSHMHRLRQKGWGLTSRNVSTRGEEVTPSSPGIPGSRLRPATCLAGGGVQVAAGEGKSKRGTHLRNGGPGPRALRCGRSAGPGLRRAPKLGTSPRTVPWVAAAAGRSLTRNGRHERRP